jgi:hypothetical protein
MSRDLAKQLMYFHTSRGVFVEHGRQTIQRVEHEVQVGTDRAGAVIDEPEGLLVI